MSQIIKPEPLHTQAYQIIRTMILEGEYEPGERFVEVKLADKLGISRGPIREAIRMLIHDGLLIQDEGPVQLYQPSLNDIVDVFQCREYLEALAVRLAVENFTNELLDELALIIQKTKEAIKNNAKNEVSTYDQKFHELIIETSGNKQLIILNAGIRTKITYMRNTILRNYYDHFDFIDEHMRIYEALVKKDVTTAEQQMKDHIKSNLDFIVKIKK